MQKVEHCIPKMMLITMLSCNVQKMCCAIYFSTFVFERGREHQQ